MQGFAHARCAEPPADSGAVIKIWSIRSSGGYAPTVDETESDPADDSGRHGGPALIGANTYAFRGGERLRNDLVGSICIVWVMSGRGTVRTGPHTVEMTKASVLCLPWRHDVRWDADQRDPFRVGTVHVAPWHDARVEIEPRVPWQRGDSLLDADYRQGEPGEAVEIPLAHPDARQLVTLGGYAIDRFDRGLTSDLSLRAMGRLLLEELTRASTTASDTGPQPPLAFEQMRAFVEQNLERRFTVAEVARAGDCSASTAERLFVRWTGSSIVSWSKDLRMERASVLLSTTGLRVGEVARAVGYPDALYFSRVFAASFGVPPSRYPAVRIRP